MAHPYPASLERFPTLRQSRLSTFDKCALSAHFEEEYRHGWSGHPQARGQIAHRVYARALKVMHEQNERKIETDVMLELLLDTLRQEGVDDRDFVNIPASEVKDLRWEVIKWAHDNEFDIENLVDIEHRLGAEVIYPGTDGEAIRRTITGQLDALFLSGEDDEEAIVLDWKSTWDLPAPSEVGFEGYFQQRFYAVLVMMNYPAIQRVTTREFYTRFSVPREATVHRNELEYAQAEIAALAERFDRAFATELFPPSPGRHCQLCPRPGACPIFPGVRGQGMITDEATALRVAGERQVARKALKDRDEALKAWASVRGPVPINSTPGRERVLGFRQSTRTSRPTKDELEKQLYLHGSRIDLDELYREQTVTRFDAHYPQPIADEAGDAELMNALEQSIAQHQEDQNG